MTTTGLSKYRGLISGLKPKIVLIEEAAETFEAYVAAACFDSAEQLILVGDHQQLRAHCTDKGLEGDPFFLDVSMFERLVRNNVEYAQLTRQRRMIPEIRRALKGIYPKLEDHPSVFHKASVPGMGGVNSFFFVHNHPEAKDSLKSCININEAAMIVEFFCYLIHNGIKSTEITVLTFYNGQRKEVFKRLKIHPLLQGHTFKVATVDSYQGEENAVVILSLVRDNADNIIGFLDVENRVCVALSRAQRGFYLFGNAPMLCKANTLWSKVVKTMGKNPRRVGENLPLQCSNHGKVSYVSSKSTQIFLLFVTKRYLDADQIRGRWGGCMAPCGQDLECGHTCPLPCHP